jgi:predicted NUDIX family NTP pyrophosphohydrolase
MAAQFFSYNKVAKQSAGILLYKVLKKELYVFLVHPGGPFFAKKDLGAWSIPKGEFNDGEDPLTVARREFYEETGVQIEGDFTELSPIKQKSGKKVFAWAVEGEIDSGIIKSNTFDLEWPPRSNKLQSFPEIDRGEWFSLSTAKAKINDRQAALIDQLAEMLGYTKRA